MIAIKNLLIMLSDLHCWRYNRDLLTKGRIYYAIFQNRKDERGRKRNASTIYSFHIGPAYIILDNYTEHIVAESNGR